MITSKSPETWQELQAWVARILDQCGFAAQIERPVTLVRGEAEVDVYAEDLTDGRRNLIFCECKHWKAAIPQTVVHGFRTVVADGGANVGYLITSSKYQPGAFSAAELTNLRLVTWPEFQDEFEQTWIDRYLRPTVHKRLDPLVSHTEWSVPRRFENLDGPRRERYVALSDKYWDFGHTIMMFVPQWTWLMTIKGESAVAPPLPLRDRYRPSGRVGGGPTYMPAAVLDATGYQELLDAMLDFGEQGLREFEALLDDDA